MARDDFHDPSLYDEHVRKIYKETAEDGRRFTRLGNLEMGDSEEFRIYEDGDSEILKPGGQYFRSGDDYDFGTSYRTPEMGYAVSRRGPVAQFLGRATVIVLILAVFWSLSYPFWVAAHGDWSTAGVVAIFSAVTCYFTWDFFRSPERVNIITGKVEKKPSAFEFAWYGRF